MHARRSRDARATPPPTNGSVSVSLVPASLSSPLGILDVATLQFLLSSSDTAPPRQHQITATPHSEDDVRPASSELARAYGVSREDDPPPPPRHVHRRVLLVEAKRRLAPSLKLEPMNPTPSPLRRQRRRPAHQNKRELHRDTQRSPRGIAAKASATRSSALPICCNEQRSLEEAARNPVVYPSAHLHILHDDNDRLLPKRSPAKSSGATSELVEVAPARRLSLPHRRAREETNNKHDDDDDDKLRRQVQWIHAHFPVRRLANAKCSLALRGKIFVDTMRTNLLRGSMRSALAQWQWVVSTLKQIELSKLMALDRLVAVYEHAARDQVAHRFDVWMRYVDGCRDTEQFSAAVAIQQWVVWCRQRREGRQCLLALNFARTVTRANENATRIQCRYRGHAARQKLRNALQAMTTIQRSVRATKQRRLCAEQQAAARRLEELYAQLRRNEQLEMLLMRSRDRQARRIAATWRAHASWRAQLVQECVANMVDQVEFFAAVRSIQRHIRGYQCRFRMKRETRACVRIQCAWRQSVVKCHARKQRKMLVLTQNMAVSCLQRTFQRNRERKKYRATMLKSARPMFMRALGASPSFRVRFHVPIVKSAVSVIQSTWRRHAAYARWKRQREMATRRILFWHRRVRLLSAWQRTAKYTMAAHRDARRDHAARRLQRWLVACTRLQVESKRACAARQIVGMLQSVMTIQRYYRRKKDPWRRLLQGILQPELPRYRHASTIIQKCWRAYADKKRHLLVLYGSDAATSGLPRALGLRGLQDYLTRLQRELERRTRAARVIQKAVRQRLARREGKLLLKKYRLLFHRELRRRQQRGVIHSFLVERQDARALRQQQQPSPLPSLSPSSSPASSAASPESVGTPTMAANDTTTMSSPQETLDEGDANNANRSRGDDPDVVQCWSDEQQSFYWYNTRTGEATWCT